jgi:hypothetical protein
MGLLGMMMGIGMVLIMIGVFLLLRGEIASQSLRITADILQRSRNMLEGSWSDGCMCLVPSAERSISSRSSQSYRAIVHCTTCLRVVTR